MNLHPLKIAGTAATGNLPPNFTGVTQFTAGSGVCTLAGLPLSFQNQAPWSIEVWFSLDALVDFMPLVSKNQEFMLAVTGRSLTAGFSQQIMTLRNYSALRGE